MFLGEKKTELGSYISCFPAPVVDQQWLFPKEKEKTSPKKPKLLLFIRFGDTRN